MNRSSLLMLLVLVCSTPMGLSLADSIKERTLTLRFTPQETTSSSRPTAERRNRLTTGQSYIRGQATTVGERNRRRRHRR